MTTQHPLKTRRNGFVLVIVLGMLILLSIILLAFNRQSRAALHSADRFSKSRQAQTAALAGLNIAIAALRDNPDIRTNRTLASILAGQTTFEVGDATCSITLAEESGKLNVNLLTGKDGVVNRPATERLLRLIELINRDGPAKPVACDIVPAIIDWTDADEQATCLSFVKFQNLGAESDYYNTLACPYNCKNAPFDATEELLLIKGVSAETFGLLREYLTVYGDGQVNINAAPQKVIECLSEKMDPALARLIVERRKFKPFESISELRNIPGMPDSVYQSIKKNVCVTPNQTCYHVLSRANLASVSSEVTAVLGVNHEAKSVDVILYKEFQ